MPHSALAQPYFRSNLADRPSVRNQLAQPLSLDSTFRGMPLPIRRDEPVLLHPIRHCRRVLPESLRDSLDAQALTEQQLE